MDARVRRLIDGAGDLLVDDRTITPAALAERVAALAQRLAGDSCRRLVIAGAEVDTPAVGLLAALSVGADAVLLRGGPVPEGLGADARLGDGDAYTPPQAGGPDAAAQAGAGAGRGEVWIATSGTTGAPKLARHSLDSLLGRIPAVRVAADRRWLLTYHPAAFAGLQVLLTALCAGAGLVAASAGTVAALTAAAVRHAPCFASGTPTFWRAFLTALGPDAARVPLRRITLGGETADQGTLDRLAAAWPGAAIVHIYASTEAGALFAVKDGRAGFPAAWLEDGVDGCALRIRDGVLEVRSPRAMRGYAGAGAETPAAAGGWLVTGDAVERVGDRVLFRGRADSVINVGGAKVRPETVEAVLLDLPMVADVRVYGRRNPITGALVAAEVVLAPGADEAAARHALLERARALLQDHEVPRLVTFVPALGTGATLKKART
ncbi:class I adenylate-forming enzyme family protein [Azospirillum halopraeferens]|uniref:class I adenylate-forming enzyme family protein n=1 Tax=Azospirillum halopraeferens TaxID=34010 RepID=UPI0004295BE8|nr:fatty acid--CoA ligase family protein [Azospirillum halopraeferens]